MVHGDCGAFLYLARLCYRLVGVRAVCRRDIQSLWIKPAVLRMQFAMMGEMDHPLAAARTGNLANLKNYLMTHEELNERIQEIEQHVAPFLTELRRLKKLRAGRAGAEGSLVVRQAKKAVRDELIKQQLDAGLLNYGRRNGGLIKAVALQFDISERTVSRLYAAMRSDICE